MDTNIIKKIEKEVSNGYISKKKHPTEDIFILNYTKKTQYDWRWNDATSICRGLIIDKNYHVIEKPFRKFFTYEQYKQIRSKTGQLYKVQLKHILDKEGIVSIKHDGVLGILYWINDVPFIATRGSFDSIWAQIATNIIQNAKDTWQLFNMNYTYLFEIVCKDKDNQIVIDYKEDNLIPIAVINKVTGKDNIDEFISFTNNWYGNVDLNPTHLTKTTLRAILESEQSQEIEGYVIHYPELNDFRIKIKHDWYVDLHRILMNLTQNKIFDMFCDDSWQEKIPKLPDELQLETLNNIKRLQKQYDNIEFNAKKYFRQYKKYARASRREFAEVIAQVVPRIYHGILFNMLDDKTYEKCILTIMKKNKENI